MIRSPATCSPSIFVYERLILETTNDLSLILYAVGLSGSLRWGRANEHADDPWRMKSAKSPLPALPPESVTNDLMCTGSQAWRAIKALQDKHKKSKEPPPAAGCFSWYDRLCCTWFQDGSNMLTVSHVGCCNVVCLVPQSLADMHHVQVYVQKACCRSGGQC